MGDILNSIINAIKSDPSRLGIPIISALCVAFILFIMRSLFKKISPAKYKKILEAEYQVHWISPPPKFFPDKAKTVGLKRNFYPLRNKVSPGQKQIIFITGLPGAGTSHMCRLLAGELQTKYNHIGYFNCREFNGSLDYAADLCREHSENNFKGNTPDKFLEWLDGLSGSTVLFFDNIHSSDQLRSIRQLFSHRNISIVIASSLMSWDFVDKRIITHEVRPLTPEESEALFSQSLTVKLSPSRAKQMLAYSYNLPFLIEVIYNAINANEGLGANLFNGISKMDMPWMLTFEDEENHRDNMNPTFKSKIRNFLIALYRVNELTEEEKETLEILALFHSFDYTPMFFMWFGIDEQVCPRLTRLRWLNCERSESLELVYTMPEIMYSIISHINRATENIYAHVKAFSLRRGLNNAVIRAGDFFWKEENVKYFIHFSIYAEKIFGLAKKSDLRDTREWGRFALTVAEGSRGIYTTLRWLNSYDPNTLSSGDPLRVSYAFALFKVYSLNCNQISLDRTLIAEKVYSLAQKTQDEYDDYILKKNDHTKIYEQHQVYGFLDVKTEIDPALERQLLTFMAENSELNQVSEYIKDVFLDNKRPKESRITALRSYIAIHIKNDQLESIKTVVEDIPPELIQDNSIYCAWLCRDLKKAYDHWNDTEKSAEYMEKWIIENNLAEGFCSKHLRNDLEALGHFLSDGKFSESLFADYMMSTPALRQNLYDCINQLIPDSEALYILGRYHENQGDMPAAIDCYGKAMTAENPSAACALAYLYYSGKASDVLEVDLEEAEKLWLFGRSREHGGSCRWLYELYKDKDLEKAKRFLLEAVKFGSHTAKKIKEYKGF